ncbi:hypothetical protein M422DRAFT_270140 [Sphaerobolus stellatus SS14]|uniref:Chromo domain-containing protein n=1 Tax=Sphaerobolus stellatus (strain SS14) TaxID=990650 RepID=A0A0C9TGH8_SPHS4|nr:hypothetical protein M422DRAFT_270140 [Sphaerobolus stellatus SS14]
MPKGRVVDNNRSTVGLELPPELIKRRIHLTFYMKLIRSHIENDDECFPNREVNALYELGKSDKSEWFVNEIIGHRWTNKGKIDFQVKWTLGNVTWELLQECNKLEALKRYLEIHGIDNPRQLPRHH